MLNPRPNYEPDAETFPAEAYTAAGWRGVAWYVYGWETVPDNDTEWTGEEVRTGEVIAVMVGDDRRYRFSPEELTPLAELGYCAECGQIGCGHDGRERG